jgi:hypothetical protein
MVTLSHASSPTPFSQACYALNTQTRAFSGTTPSSSFLSFQVRLAPGLRGAKTRARRVLLSGNLTLRYLTTPPLAFPEYQTLHSDEMPLGGVATRIGEAFGPALDAIAEQQSQR